jgi:hypothetical protein
MIEVKLLSNFPNFMMKIREIPEKVVGEFLRQKIEGARKTP